MNEIDRNTGIRNMTRRDFLKLIGGFGLVHTDIGRYLTEVFGKPDSPPMETSPSVESLKFTSEIMNGVDVYGLKERISSALDVSILYGTINIQFVERNNIQRTNTAEQRKDLLNPHERYLEVVVRRSAFDSFTQKQHETGVNFPEWIKIHVDVMNRCMKAAKPPVDMRAVLRRIVVIEDDAVKDFWDENDFRNNNGLGKAFDVAWVRKFYPFCFDTDESWAVADDYRDLKGLNFWEIRQKNDKTIIGNPALQKYSGYQFEFPEEEDSLSDKNRIRIDMSLIHEWSHYLLNLPDEYTQDVHDPTQRIKEFTFRTGCFSMPYMSPYLSALLQENIKRKARDYFGTDNNRSFTYNERPGEIEISVQFQNPGATGWNVEVRRVRLENNDIYGRKEVPKNADQTSETESIKLNDDVFAETATCWLISAKKMGDVREVFLPLAAFTMSAIAGLKSVTYNLIFCPFDGRGDEIIVKAKQEVRLIQDTDIDEFLQNSPNLPYAKMKIEGTDTWFVWFEYPLETTPRKPNIFRRPDPDR